MKLQLFILFIALSNILFAQTETEHFIFQPAKGGGTLITPKEKKEILITEQPKILAAEIPKHEQPAQEQEEIKKDILVDGKANNSSNSEEPKKLSRKERLLAIKNSEEKIIDVQKNQEKFIWTPSIKK